MTVADEAARIAAGFFPDGDPADFASQVEWKPDHSPVTVADRETEQLLRKPLHDAFPDDGFLGEEYGDTPGTSGFRWIIDPIDGTRSFVRGIPIWATLVGLEYQGEQIAGVVDVPALGQTYRALRGDGAYRNDRRHPRLRRGGRCRRRWSSTPACRGSSRRGARTTFLELARRTERQRGFGDFYGFVLVAQGRGELMVEHGVHAWDVAAIKPIVEEAGGRFSDWDGGRPSTGPTCSSATASCTTSARHPRP